ncbi:basic amino acid ABC transporter substrate-binding protein [Paenibacillus sp. GCM10023252]|uniref:basic amino acid ABC transporter substrate-binding protein n=1 Tax=Paenibacillus sp. GCM10023252 TaxID=3252649 RepID=UPI00361ACF7C
MKRWMMAGLMAVLVFALAACGAQSNNESASGEISEGDNKIMFATDAAYAPMESMDKDKIVGFDIDFLAAVAKEAGINYEVKNTGWDSMLTLVQAGKEYQAGISSVSITDERKETYDYSSPYFESTNMILTKEGSPIKSALDLKDKKVAVQLGTTADTLMSDIMGKDSTSLKKFESNALALLELENSGVDAVVADVAIVKEYMKNNPDKKFTGILDKDNFGAEFYGILLPKGSELKAKLDPAIKTIIENGEYAKIYEKWFGEQPNTEILLNAAKE